MNNPDNKTTNFIQRLAKLELSSIEAQDMRERLAAYADLHAAARPVRRAVLSPFYFRVVTAFAILMLLVGGSVGVSYAAEDALPGQPFYQVKVSVIEPIQGALIPTTAGKAQWENVLAERRLTEASTLAAQGKLSTSTTDFIASQVALDTSRSESDASKLAASGNTDAALGIRSDLEARLSAHAALLAVIAPRLADAGDASSTEQVALLFQKVNAARVSVEQTRQATEAALQASTTVAVASFDTRPRRAAQVTPQAALFASSTAVIAMADKERVAEEQSLFNTRIHSLLSLIPHATSTATTTATSTATTTDTSTSTATTSSTVQDGDSMGTR